MRLSKKGRHPGLDQEFPSVDMGRRCRIGVRHDIKIANFFLCIPFWTASLFAFKYKVFISNSDYLRRVNLRVKTCRLLLSKLCNSIL